MILSTSLSCFSGFQTFTTALSQDPPGDFRLRDPLNFAPPPTSDSWRLHWCVPCTCGWPYQLRVCYKNLYLSLLASWSNELPYDLTDLEWWFCPISPNPISPKPNSPNPDPNPIPNPKHAVTLKLTVNIRQNGIGRNGRTPEWSSCLGVLLVPPLLLLLSALAEHFIMHSWPCLLKRSIVTLVVSPHSWIIVTANQTCLTSSSVLL